VTVNLPGGGAVNLGHCDIKAHYTQVRGFVGESKMRFSERTLAGMIASDFDRIANQYERLQATLSDRASARLVGFAGVSEGQTVLDIGTGTGSAAFAAARLVGPRGLVTGIDVSNGMLSVASRKAASQELSNLRFIMMDASLLEFGGCSFDVVISNLGIPTYRFHDAVSEAFRVLKTGGSFCFAEFTGLPPAWFSLSKVLSKFAVKRAPPELQRRRQARAQMAKEAAKFPLSSFSGVLKSVGFVHLQTSVYGITVPQPPSNLYLRYLITRERLEYDAMPKETKRQFREEMMRRLEDLRGGSSGKLERRVRFWLAQRPNPES